MVGKFDKSDHFGFVTPDHTRLIGDIYIPKDYMNGAQKGQKVVVELQNGLRANRNAEGQIVKSLAMKMKPVLT